MPTTITKPYQADADGFIPFRPATPKADATASAAAAAPIIAPAALPPSAAPKLFQLDANGFIPFRPAVAKPATMTLPTPAAPPPPKPFQVDEDGFIPFRPAVAKPAATAGAAVSPPAPPAQIPPATASLKPFHADEDGFIAFRHAKAAAIATNPPAVAVTQPPVKAPTTQAAATTASPEQEQTIANAMTYTRGQAGRDLTPQEIERIRSTVLHASQITPAEHFAKKAQTDQENTVQNAIAYSHAQLGRPLTDAEKDHVRQTVASAPQRTPAEVLDRLTQTHSALAYGKQQLGRDLTPGEEQQVRETVANASDATPLQVEEQHALDHAGPQKHNPLQAAVVGTAKLLAAPIKSIAPDRYEQLVHKMNMDAPVAPTLLNKLAEGVGVGTAYASGAEVLGTLAPLAFAAHGATSAAGDVRGEIAERRAAGQQISGAQEAKAATGAGVIGGALNYVVPGAINKVAPAVARQVANSAVGRAAAAVATDITAGAGFGAGQQLGNNVIARNTFDPNRRVTQGVGDAAAGGAAAGLGASPLSVAHSLRQPASPQPAQPVQVHTLRVGDERPLLPGPVSGSSVQPPAPAAQTARADADGFIPFRNAGTGEPVADRPSSTSQPPQPRSDVPTFDADGLLEKLMQTAGGDKRTRQIRDFVFNAKYSGEGLSRALGIKQTSIHPLVQAGLIDRTEAGKYQLNPAAFADRAPASDGEPVAAGGQGQGQAQSGGIRPLQPPESPTPQPSPQVQGEGAQPQSFPPRERVRGGINDTVIGDREPLDKYAPVLHTEQSAEKATRLLGIKSAGMAPSDSVYLSNDPDMATGQGGNSGVRMEFDSRGLTGVVNTAKPGWDFQYDQGKAEFLGSDGPQQYLNAVRKVTIDPKTAGNTWATARMKSVVLPALARRFGGEIKNDNGVISWQRPDSHSGSTIAGDPSLGESPTSDLPSPRPAPSDVGPHFATGVTRIGRAILPPGQVAITDPATASAATRELFDYANTSTGGKELRGIVHRAVEPAEADEIRSRTGLDVSGFTHLVDNYAARHAESRHGLYTADELQGQVPVTAEDFAKLPDLVRPENIVRAGENDRGQHVIVYKKAYNGHYIIAEELRNKRRQLAVASMLKTKRGAGLPGEEPNAVTASTTQFRSTAPLTDNIGSSSSEVKENPPTGGGGAAGEVATVPIDSLSVDPTRFQYKSGTDAGGASALLKGVSRFDRHRAGVVATWVDPADGREYVINGHHRYELAKRTGEKTLNVIRIPAANAGEAKHMGAMINIAEGRGTSVDAAKIFRMRKMDAQALSNSGISLTEGVAQRGLALSKLDGSLFHQVAIGQMPESRGVAIGEALGDHVQQKALADLLARQEQRGRAVTNDEVGELARFVAGAGTRTETQSGLFGDDQIVQSNALEKARLSAWFKRQLKTDAKLFGAVGRESAAEKLRAAGNVIDDKSARDRQSAAEEALYVYDKLSTAKGPVSQALNEAAAELAAKPGAFDAIAQNLKSQLSDALTIRGDAANIEHGQARAGSRSSDQGGPAAAERPIEQQTTGIPVAGGGTNLFGQPEFNVRPGETNTFGFKEAADRVLREQRRNHSDEIVRQQLPPTDAQLAAESDRETGRMFGDDEPATRPDIAAEPEASEPEPPTIFDKPKPLTPGDKLRVQAFRKLADGMQTLIEEKRNPAVSQQNLTARRARIAEGMGKDADRIERAQNVLRNMASAIEAGTLQDSLSKVATRAQIEVLLDSKTYPRAYANNRAIGDLLAKYKGKPGMRAVNDELSGFQYRDNPRLSDSQVEAVKQLIAISKKYGDGPGSYNINISSNERLRKAGIDETNYDQVRRDLEQYIGRVKVDPQAQVKAMERELIGQKIPGFFPTPKPVIDRMLAAADIQPGDKVLEPSAGKGDIADAIKATGADVDTAEYQQSLQGILKAKGHNVVGDDAMQQKGEYDKIVMNPPFENGQDIDHVRYAFDNNLKPGGKLVAIMSEGPFFHGDKKASEFRDWLEAQGGTSERLDPRSFTGKDAFRQTGVATRLVTIEKPPAVGQAAARSNVDPRRRGHFTIPDPLSEKGFVKSDVMPTAKAAVQGILQGAQQARRIFAPTTAGKDANVTGNAIREMGAQAAQRSDQAEQGTQEARRFFDGQTEAHNLKFIDDLENGSRQPTAQLQSMASVVRNLLDGRRDEIRALGTGKLEHFIKDYFPHIWQDEEAAGGVVARWLGRRPIEGNKNFLKHRAFPTIAEGMAAGLKPMSTNPIELTLLQLRQMDKYILSQRLIAELKDKKLITFKRASDVTPEGYGKLNDKFATVYGPKTVRVPAHMTASGQPEDVPTVGQQILGHWIAPSQVADVLNNHLSPSIRQRSAIFRGFMTAGNVLNQAQLGMSAFHLGFTSMDAATSTLSVALERLAQGKPLSAAKLAAITPLAPFRNYLLGSKVLREWFKPGTQGGDFADIVDAVKAAGGRVQTDKLYRTSMVEQMAKAFREGSPLKAAWRLPLATVDALSKPILEHIVPRQKLAVFADMARNAMENLPAGYTHDQFRHAMARAWDSADNRMGQIVYDNLFWNNIAKDLAMVSTRSVGWNLGTLRELGGGVVDWAKQPINAATGKPIEMTHRMAYTVALPVLTGLIGGVLHYMLTGERPKEAKDLFFPRTGGKDDFGRDERISLPGYMKDVWHYATDPIGTLTNKMHPLFGAIADIYPRNKDYYGTEIYPNDASGSEKVLDSAKYFAKQAVPLAISGYQKMAHDGEPMAKRLLPFVGVTPAPHSATATDAERLAEQLTTNARPAGARTQAEADRSQLKRDLMHQLRQAVAAGQLDPDSPDYKQQLAIAPAMEQARQAVKDGKLKWIDLNDIGMDYALDPLTREVKGLSTADAVRIYQAATPEERDRLRDVVASHIAHTADGSQAQDRYYSQTGIEPPIDLPVTREIAALRQQQMAMKDGGPRMLDADANRLKTLENFERTIGKVRKTDQANHADPSATDERVRNLVSQATRRRAG